MICLVTFANNYLEVFDRKNTKPEFNKSLSYISNSSENNVILITTDKDSDQWLLNYFKKNKFSKYENLNFIEESQLNSLNQIWNLCYLP